MSAVTDLTMAIDTTFGSILSQIQLSNLNFSIQLTPFAAYITLKKSVQKDLNGVPARPSPSLLLLLQQAHQEHLALQAKFHDLKVDSEIIKNKFDALANENISLVERIEEKTTNVEVMEADNKHLHSRLDFLEKEHANCCAAKAVAESKVKEIKKKQSEEVRDLKVQTEKLTKALKSKENVVNALANARETIKSLKAEKSALKMSRNRLEGETRRLKRRLKSKVENNNICKSNMTGGNMDDKNKSADETNSENADSYSRISLIMDQPRA